MCKMHSYISWVVSILLILDSAFHVTVVSICICYPQGILSSQMTILEQGFHCSYSECLIANGNISDLCAAGSV